MKARLLSYSDSSKRAKMKALLKSRKFAQDEGASAELKETITEILKRAKTKFAGQTEIKIIVDEG